MIDIEVVFSAHSIELLAKTRFCPKKVTFALNFITSENEEMGSGFKIGGKQIRFH